MAEQEETQQAQEGAGQEQKEPQKAKNLPPAILMDRYNIHPSLPLPDLSTPSARAFVAEDKRTFFRQVYGCKVFAARCFQPI